MPGPEFNPFAKLYSYNSINSSDNLLLLGGNAKFSTGTSASFGVGSFIKDDEKPLFEIKLGQDIGKIGNVNFNAGFRGRFKTDGYRQYRGNIEASYPMKNNVKPYVSASYSNTNGKDAVGGFAGISYNKISAEIEYKHNIPDNKNNYYLNLIFGF